MGYRSLSLGPSWKILTVRLYWQWLQRNNMIIATEFVYWQYIYRCIRIVNNVFEMKFSERIRANMRETSVLNDQTCPIPYTHSVTAIKWLRMGDVISIDSHVYLLLCLRATTYRSRGVILIRVSSRTLTESNQIYMSLYRLIIESSFVFKNARLHPY